MRQRKNNQKGFASLVSVLLAAAIVLVMLAALIPNTIRAMQSRIAATAAEQLAQIGASEMAMAQLYGEFVSPANLTGTLTSPISCNNPFLVSGAEIQAPENYTLTFAGGSSQSGISGCTVAGFKTYTMNADPATSLAGSRHFFLDQTGVVRFTNENREANASDAIYPITTPARGFVSTILSTQAVGTGNPGNTPANTFSGTTPSMNFTTGLVYAVPLNTSGAQQPCSIASPSCTTATMSSAISSTGLWQSFQVTITPNPQQGSSGGYFDVWFQDLTNYSTLIDPPSLPTGFISYCGSITVPSGGDPVPAQSITCNDASPFGQINSGDSMTVLIAPHGAMPDVTINWVLTYAQ